MKITSTDYAVLRTIVHAVLSEVVFPIEDVQEMPVRFIWQVWNRTMDENQHAYKTSARAKYNYEFMRGLYKYLNDANIETAMRKIINVYYQANRPTMTIYPTKTLKQLQASRVTKGEMFEALKEQRVTFDYALPQTWLDEIAKFAKSISKTVTYDLIVSTTVWYYRQGGDAFGNALTGCAEVKTMIDYYYRTRFATRFNNAYEPRTDDLHPQG